MVSAYIMVKLEAGREGEVFAEVEKSREIKEASATYGAYDLLIKVKFEKIEELDRFIFDVVRRFPGVKETVTMIVAKTIVQ
ncbi:MAG: Lrp/AsnC ligand binding domain-containing protein [bacterium]